MAQRKKKKLSNTAHGSVIGNKPASPRTALTTRSTGSTTKAKAKGGGGSRRMGALTCAMRHMESLRLAHFHLESAYSYRMGSAIWTRLALEDMIAALLWMIEGQPLSTARCLKAASDSILGIVQNTPPSPSASKTHGSSS